MLAPVLFGYALIAASAVLLAGHWQQWLEARSLPSGQRRRGQFLRLQAERRTVASGLIGVIGAAISLEERVPHDPVSMTLYLLALMTGGVVILIIALADARATRRQRDVDHLELVAAELRKLHAQQSGAA